MTQKLKIQLSKIIPFFLPVVSILHIVTVSFLIKSNAFFIVSSYVITICICLGMHAKYKKKSNDVEIKRQDLVERNNLLLEAIHKQQFLSISLDKKKFRYASLKQALDKFNQSLDIDEVGKIVTEETFRLFGRNGNVLLYLLNRETNALELLAAKKFDSKVIIKEKRGDFFDEWVLRRGCALLVEDVGRDFRFDPERVQSEVSRKLGSLIITPLVSVSRFVGVLRVESANAGKLSFEDIRFLAALGNLATVTLENALLYAHTEELAIRDGLTGLYMRRYLDERGREEVSFAGRQYVELSALMIDIDHFKKYNDKFGHHLGDIILLHISDLLKGMFHKKGYVVSRFGGEEFALLLPRTKKVEAKEMAEELRKSIEDGVIFLRRSPIKITVSIGVASYPRDANSWFDLIKQSDNAMYKAKQKGRNRVCIA